MRQVQAVKVFYSYAHEDETYREALGNHLAALKMNGLIEDWHDRKIVPGAAWDDEIHERLDDADLILLFISADFLGSPYCREVELTRALQRHESGEACVVPVIVRPVSWGSTPFARIQALPKNARAVSTWPNKDEAWVDVVQGIEKACRALHAALEPKEQDVMHGDTAALMPDVDVQGLKNLDTEQRPDATAGMAGGTTDVGSTALREDVDALLQRLRTLEESGPKATAVQVGTTHFSRAELLVKKAILLKTEADQILIDHGSDFANVDEALHTAKLKEAHHLLEEALALDPTNTEVLLHLAKLLIELTPDDPRDEERLLVKVQNLLSAPRNEVEKFHLAQATFLLATLHDDYDLDRLEQARALFEQLGRIEWVKQCDDLFAATYDDPAADEDSHYAENAPYAANAPVRPMPPAPPVFEPVGNWQVHINDMVGSQMYLSLQPDGSFHGSQQALGMNVQAMGQWGYNPHNRFLQIQGMINGFQPFGLGIMIHGFQQNAFFGVGVDGFGYRLFRA